MFLCTLTTSESQRKDCSAPQLVTILKVKNLKKEVPELSEYNFLIHVHCKYSIYYSKTVMHMISRENAIQMQTKQIGSFLDSEQRAQEKHKVALCPFPFDHLGHLRTFLAHFCSVRLSFFVQKNRTAVDLFSLGDLCHEP